MTKIISLTAELAEVRSAIQGAQFIADALAARGFDNQRHELQAPVSITAILVLAELRLHQVERVLRGEEDPQHLWAPHNDVTPGGGERDEQDVMLRPWNQAEETKGPVARKKTERSRPRERRGQARPPKAGPRDPLEGGGAQPPPSGTPS